ncbi:glycoside hydrolase family 9 protein [Cohnella sp. GbtcB17]|uniref:glycoside hydrolase family 9 protein n=1 Tax=Cohnella sp. GbtcB17 TaxID=2824762 RepID=UPI001C2F10DD|nr:glycoside hydrolase family 9 protein [Cohnella sp. GbtcB17]
MFKVLKTYTVLLTVAILTTAILSACGMREENSVQANASGIFIRVNQVGYSPGASKVGMVLSSTNLSGVRYDVYNSSNTSVLNGTISSASKGSWGDAGGANIPYSYALDFSSLNTIGNGYYIKINTYKSPTFNIDPAAYSSLADLSMKFFKVQRCGNTNPDGHLVCHVPGSNSSVDGKPDGASGTKDFTGGWHDASDYIKFMSTIGHVADVMLTTYVHHPEVFPEPGSINGVLTEAKVGLDFIQKMWDNTNQMLYMEVADGLDHDVENDDLDSRSKTWPQNDNTIYGAARPVHPSPAGTGANLAGKAAAALALGAKIWGDPNGPSYNAALASSYLTAAQQIYTWGKTRTGIAGDADEFYVDTDYKDDMAWAAAELYRATGTASYLTEAKAYSDSAGEWYNKSDTSLNWSRAYHWANYEIASLDPTYKNTAAGRINNHLNLKKNYANGQFWNTSSDPKWGTYEAMSNNAVEAMMYQELTGNTTYAALAQQQIDFMLGKNPWGVSMLNGAGTTWFKNPRHRVTTLNRVTNPNYQLRGSWSEGFETSAQYAVDQQDPLLAGQEDPAIVQFNDNRMIWHDNRRDYATNEVTISGNAAGMAMVAFMGGGSSASTDYTTNGDAYVRDGTYETTNYGTASTIDIKGDPDAGYNRKGFVKFDLTGRAGTSVASALLKVYVNAASAATPVKVYGLAGNDSWIESGTGGITWNNQPGSTNAVLIGTLNVSAAGWYTIDATTYVNSQFGGDKKVTFKLQVENNNGASISLNSKENTANKPVLTVN